ncbi:MAG TPA: hypothetical protein ENJ89_05115 [Caldithrix abyssi]|uniref:HEAT repeat domain-containing protein n=1 Tax=Caldithrix abyssi TaxID=187145 RepID=A0A7V5PNV9_CALAY|nr:hypothetical protein [Caldithrix abyssi]
MSVIDRLASMQGRSDDVPNQELAKELAEKKDSPAIEEIVRNLNNKNKRIQSDCIKVLYEIGYIEPQLIQPYADTFLSLLESKNNRLVWGGMIALSTIAPLQPDRIFERIDLVIKTIENGSVITVDRGIKTLALVASANDKYNKKIFPFLIDHLRTCRPKDLPQHAESIAVAVTDQNKADFISVLEERKALLKPSQRKRVEKVIRSLTG